MATDTNAELNQLEDKEAPPAVTPEIITAGEKSGNFSAKVFARDHGYASLLVGAIGVLLILFGCLIAAWMRTDPLASFAIAFTAVSVGAFLIGFAKLVEAAELYIRKFSDKDPN